MRRVIFAINLTLDGCCDHSKGSGSEDLLEYHGQLIREVDLVVFGRKTYQLMVPYWPEAANDPSEPETARAFGRSFDAANKIVFSRSLASAGGRNTRIVRGNLHDEILKLKQEGGGDILVGGVDVPSQLVELGLVDEFRFVIQPIVAGEGRRLLDGTRLGESLRVRLADSKILRSGCVALRYEKQ